MRGKLDSNVRANLLCVVALSVCAGFPLFGATTYTATQTGTAVYYSDKMDGKGLSQKGETYDKHALTAATHKRYPLGSMLRVTNISTNKSVTVRVNDRMNPKSKAVIDLSRKAAEEIGMIESGHAKVRLELLPTK
jgi:rare lipoprotein A